MIVDDISMPNLPSSIANATHGVIIKFTDYGENEDGTVNSDELVTSYICIGASGEFVHVPASLAAELGFEAYNWLYCTGTMIGAYNWSEGESAWTTNENADAIVEQYALPLLNLMGLGLSVVWSNHYIMTATGANVETEEVTVGDKVYFGSCVHQGKSEYSVPSNGILAAANLVRLLGPKVKMTIDDMYDFITSPAAGWMEKMVIPGLTLDPLLSLGLLGTGITSYAEKFDIFPFQLYLLVQKVNLPNATEIGFGAFASQVILEELNAPKLQKIGDSALPNYKAETVDFPLVTYIGEGAFSGADMTQASFPATVEIGAEAFENCAGLTSFTIPATVTYLGKAGEPANPFPGCTALTTITVDSGNVNYCSVGTREVYSKDMTVLVTPAIGAESYAVKDGVKTIARSAFARDVSLKSITIPSTVEYIGQEAFGYCDALEKLDIPATVAEIGSSIVTGCDSMTTLILRKSDAIYEDSIYFMKMGSNDGTGFVYVPSALLETYKASDGWSTYAAQFRAIEDYPDICG